mmetsp:Transcript_10775/g.37543  ORF Transcript_10775/g.37543 Transcript_10775/m.37543 type:complete len:110 (-) Transcript_10775:34-363(-)
MAAVVSGLKRAFNVVSSAVVGDDNRPVRRRGPNDVPWRTVLMAVTLFAVGTVFLVLGVNALKVDRERAIAMIVLGSICFLPGSWASYNLYGTWKRWPGFRYDYVPSYDD